MPVSKLSSDELVSVIEHRPSGDRRSNQWFNPASQGDDVIEGGKRMGCWLRTSSWWKGLLIGCLVGGIALGAIIPLWLTSTGKATDQAVVGAWATTNASTTVVSTPAGNSSSSGPSTSSSNGSAISSTAASSSTTAMNSTAVATSQTTLSTTTQSPTVVFFDRSNLAENQWVRVNFSRITATTANVTITLTMEAGTKHEWYLDDVSVKDSASNDMLTNGDFETGSSLAGWTLAAGSCSSALGISTTRSHSTSQSLYSRCHNVASIFQSFAALAGQVYEITLWLYLERSGNGGGGQPTLTVMVN